MRDIGHINVLLSSKQEKLKLQDVYKDKMPPEKMILSGILWSWVQDIEKILLQRDGIQLEVIQNLIRKNLESSTLEFKQLIESELDGHNSNGLYMSRVHPNINEFAIGATLYTAEHLEIGISFLDEESIHTRKKTNKEKQTGFYIDASTVLLACIKGSAKLGCWTLGEPISEKNIPQKFEGNYKEIDISAGEVYTILGAKQGITFLSVDKQAAFIIVKINKGKSSVALQFDSKSYELLATVSTDPVTSRFQVATVALRALQGGEDVELLRHYLQHNNAYVRWHSAREIYLRDSVEAKSVFKQLSKDNSPMVRESANRCLNELYGE